MYSVISIQSQVVYGHVGNSAAVFPMQSKGINVLAVPTTLLSNHPHYPTMRGKILEHKLVEDLLLGIEERGLIEKTETLVTGFLGSIEIANVVDEFISLAQKRNPHMIYVCDPVMGDDDLGVFVDENLLSIFSNKLIPKATIITPNQFELELITGRSARNIEDLQNAAERLINQTTKSIVVTGCILKDSEDGYVETIVCENSKVHRIPIKKLPVRPCGTGDLFTALMISHLSQGKNLILACEAAVSEVFKTLEQTLLHESNEMRLLKN